MQNDYKRFDIVMVDFGANTIGSEQGYTRPALIVQNNQGNSFSSCTIVIPFSHVLKGLHIPTHALIKKGVEILSFLHPFYYPIAKVSSASTATLSPSLATALPTPILPLTLMSSVSNVRTSPGMTF